MIRPCWLAHLAETGPRGNHTTRSLIGPRRPSFSTSPSTRPAQCPGDVKALARDEAVPPVRVEPGL